MFIWDFVASAILSEILDWVYGQIIGFLGNFFEKMGNMGVELFELTWVQAVVQFFSQLGWALFGVSLVVCAFECGIEYSSGRGNIRQTALNILKGFMAVSLFTTVPVRLYALSVSLQGTLSRAIIDLELYNREADYIFNRIESSVVYTGSIGKGSIHVNRRTDGMDIKATMISARQGVIDTLNYVKELAEKVQKGENE